jgi:hypothetical protein
MFQFSNDKMDKFKKTERTFLSEQWQQHTVNAAIAKVF